MSLSRDVTDVIVTSRHCSIHNGKYFSLQMLGAKVQLLMHAMLMISVVCLCYEGIPRGRNRILF